MITTTFYCHYSLTGFIQNLPKPVAGQLISMWRSNNILPTHVDPAERIKDVVVVKQDAAGKVVGVSSVHTVFRPVLKEQTYLYRMFIQPKDRISGMRRQLARMGFTLLGQDNRGCDIWRKAFC